jgi:hypothetical protein
METGKSFMARVSGGIEGGGRTENTSAEETTTLSENSAHLPPVRPPPALNKSSELGSCEEVPSPENGSATANRDSSLPSGNSETESFERETRGRGSSREVSIYEEAVEEFDSDCDDSEAESRRDSRGNLEEPEETPLSYPTTHLLQLHPKKSEDEGRSSLPIVAFLCESTVCASRPASGANNIHDNSSQLLDSESVEAPFISSKTKSDDLSESNTSDSLRNADGGGGLLPESPRSNPPLRYGQASAERRTPVDGEVDRLELLKHK